MPHTYGKKPTACLALADGTIFYGKGFGATGETQAELCFNTAMTGYQEIMTDPSYAGQIVTFTFPHIGNVGVNAEDDETADPVAAGMVVKWDPTEASNWRAEAARSPTHCGATSNSKRLLAPVCSGPLPGARRRLPPPLKRTALQTTKQ